MISMGVCDFDNSDPGDARPIETTVGFAWSLIMVWYQQKSVRVFHIHGNLFFAVRLQLMNSRLWQESQFSECIRIGDLLEAQQDAFSVVWAIGTERFLLAVQ